MCYVSLHIAQMVLYTTVQALEGSRPQKHAMCSMALVKMTLQSDTIFFDNSTAWRVCHMGI